MMGSYYYYDTSYIEDHVPSELHIHDCMWSGECYSCQPTTRLTFSGPAMAPMPDGTVPITVGGTGGYITLTTTHQDATRRGRCQQLDSNKAPMKFHFDQKSPELPLPQSNNLNIDCIKVEPTTPSRSRSRSRSLSPSMRVHLPVRAQSVVVTAPIGCTIEKSNNRAKSKKASTVTNKTFSSDNKKLRHREVEKNRHRQLQAMVKTLSERIPGRMDKETQVQTMKRAARYFVYLRDVTNALKHGQPMIPREKLEKLYLRSCDNVELIMSQHMSSKGGDSN